MSATLFDTLNCQLSVLHMKSVKFFISLRHIVSFEPLESVRGTKIYIPIKHTTKNPYGGVNLYILRDINIFPTSICIIQRELAKQLNKNKKLMWERIPKLATSSEFTMPM